MADEKKTEPDWQAEHHKLQTRLDEEIQAHVDTRAAHTVAINELKAVHGRQLTELAAAVKKQLASVAASHEAELLGKAEELAALNRSHSEGLIALAQKHAAELEAQKTAHEKHVAELKEKYLVPAVRDLHARQQADMAVQQKAALEALLNG
jgi:hypothetical protein